MSEQRRKLQHVRSEEITDLFRILKNMCRDEAVTDAHFRLAFRIAQCRDDNTGWAEASHDFLIDEVPRTQKGKIRGFRDAMRDELGWLKILKGERGRGTMYQFRDERCAVIEAEAEQKRDDRHAAAAVRNIERTTALKAASLGVNPDPSLPKSSTRLGGKYLPLNRTGKGVNPSSFEGQISTPTLPHSSTSTEGCREADETQGARTHAPVLARAVPPPCECGEPAVIRARLSGNSQLRPWCEECADDLILTDQRPLEGLDPDRGMARP